MIDPLITKLESYTRLSEEEKEFLNRSPSQFRDYQPNETIAFQGGYPTESCVIVKGFACRFKILPDGRQQILALHIPGDFCDLHSFSLKKLDHAISAVGPCSVARVPHEKLQQASDLFPNLSRAFMWNLATDAAIAREWMVSMGRRSAREQLSHLLCELLYRLKPMGLAENDAYEFPITQANLGDATGLSTVHVNRTLQELRGEGLITLRGKLLAILNLQRLKEVAGFDPGYLYLPAAPNG